MKRLVFLAIGLFFLSSADAATDNIARSIFTSRVENREPTDKVGQLSNDNKKIYFFTEVIGMSGRTVTHRWQHRGHVKAQVSFKVGSNRWRIWSSKSLQPQWLGEWIVSVMDDEGNTLKEESMAYIPSRSVAATITTGATPDTAVQPPSASH
ncbi:MAG: DUF2914 domain-containing protein [Gammaproteobacteria bacterium]|nr:DUF2914 domain-containing protein [Gammaproteobacteria bacterium]